jgi:hypothetical protein
LLLLLLLLLLLPHGSAAAVDAAAACTHSCFQPRLVSMNASCCYCCFWLQVQYLLLPLLLLLLLLLVLLLLLLVARAIPAHDFASSLAWPAYLAAANTLHFRSNASHKQYEWVLLLSLLLLLLPLCLVAGVVPAHDNVFSVAWPAYLAAVKSPRASATMQATSG